MANQIVGGHDGGRLVARPDKVLDHDFKGLHVDFTDALLIRPGVEEGNAVGLLVVEDKVLDIGIDTLFRSGIDHIGGDVAAQNAVLSVILEIPSGKGGAMGVHSGAVPTVDFTVRKLLGHGRTHPIGQLLVPGLTQQSLVGIGGAVDADIPVVQAGRLQSTWTMLEMTLPSPYVELSPYLKPGEANELSIIARNADQPNSRWYSGAGLYRPVWLWLGDRAYLPPNAIRVWAEGGLALAAVQAELPCAAELEP